MTTEALPTSSQNVVQFGGLVRAQSLGAVMDQERRDAEQTQAQPHIEGLAGHIRKCWSQARTAKQMTVEAKMLQNMRARRGEYDPDKLAEIRAMGGSEVYANLTSVKCRAAASWLRDVLMATGTERPWTVRPTPVPDLPPDMNEEILQQAVAPIKQAIMAGQPMDQGAATKLVSTLRQQAKNQVMSVARDKAENMADKMEDQLVEGGFIQALDQFIEDIVTFPAAVIKGPIVRKRKVLKWVQGEQGFVAQAEDTLKLEWERVSPFNIYPSPAATNTNEGYLLEKHKLSRDDLNAMIGVDGYDDASIRLVLDQYGRGGLTEWLTNEVAIASAEGKATTQIAQNVDGLIDALQFWGPVQGKMLIDWGLKDDEVSDPLAEYHIEAWLIGSYVIKAVINTDPLSRRPYYKASYEEIPGNFWGSSVCDLIRDPQVVANAAARALVNNMAMASGPQVVVNVERLAQGEPINTLQPWRIWQVTNDPSGANGQPIYFQQPDSRVAELVGVFEKFVTMADEYSGIPKYMAGDAGGAGRTASGLSMLMGNAGKAIKQVIANIDIGVMSQLVERLYDHNMQHSDDPDLKGDVHVVARGASSLIAKESAQVRRNEFLAATANPVDMQIVGVEGRAAILRETAKNLDMDVDKVVPPLDLLRQKWAQQQMMAQGQQGSQPAPQAGSGQQLSDGTPTTDNFQPPEK